MFKELLAELAPYKGRVSGALFGLVVGWIIIRYGVIRGIFVVLCIVLGLYLGYRYDTRGDITDVMDRILR